MSQGIATLKDKPEPDIAAARLESQAEAASAPGSYLLAIFLTAISLYASYQATSRWPCTLATSAAAHTLRLFIGRLEDKEPSQVDLDKLYRALPWYTPFLVFCARFIVAAYCLGIAIRTLDRVYVRIKKSLGSS